MTGRTVSLAAAALGACAVLPVAGAAARGAGSPAPAATKPASPGGAAATRPAVDPAAMKILKDLEAAGDKHKTIRADIDYHVVMRALGDSETRTGWVAYRKGDAKTPTMFRITFETLKQGAGRKLRARVDYAFDGQWFTVAKHKIKTMTLFQLAAKGQRIEPLRIGRGPFPLPFGQKADDVLKYFQPTTRPPTSSDPKGTRYLRLTTRARYRKSMSFERLELWIEPKTSLPVKIRSRDKSRNVTTVTFKNVKTNLKLPADTFRIPRKLGWEVHRRPLKGARKILP